jgi:Spy/CpxP family protein refolding chaperone
MKQRVKWLMIALAATGVAGAALGQNSSSPAASDSSSAGTTPAGHWHRHGPGLMVGGGLMRALHQLNLSDQQKASIKTILSSARTAARAQRQNEGAPDFTVLSNPGDPNYMTALQDLQTRAANRIQQESQTEQAIYKVLTPEQQAQLPQVLATIKASWAGHHSAS